MRTTSNRKNKNKKMITYEEYNRRVSQLENMQALGIELIHKRDMIKITCGAIMTGVGLVTLPLPTGSILLIALGVSMMANGGLNVCNYKKSLLRGLKMRTRRILGIW